MTIIKTIARTDKKMIRYLTVSLIPPVLTSSVTTVAGVSDELPPEVMVELVLVLSTGLVGLTGLVGSTGLGGLTGLTGFLGIRLSQRFAFYAWSPT